jgi:hypothetical protein
MNRDELTLSSRYKPTLQRIPSNDELLWLEVEALLKDNHLWSDNLNHSHIKNIYAVTTKPTNMQIVIDINQMHLWKPEFKEVVSSTLTDSLYRFMYHLTHCPNYHGTECYSIELPIGYDDWNICYIIITLENGTIIVGRYGTQEFGNELSDCYYYGDIKLHNISTLNEPIKSLLLNEFTNPVTHIRRSTISEEDMTDMTTIDLTDTCIPKVILSQSNELPKSSDKNIMQRLHACCRNMMKLFK